MGVDMKSAYAESQPNQKSISYNALWLTKHGYSPSLQKSYGPHLSARDLRTTLSEQSRSHRVQKINALRCVDWKRAGRRVEP